MVLLNQAPMPTQDPIAKLRRKDIDRKQSDPQENLPTQPWIEWFTSVSEAVNASAGVLQTVNLTALVASIGATALAPGSTQGGVYRLTFYDRVTTPASVSSSIIVTFAWTDGGVACSVVSPANTGNTADSVASATFMIRRDQATPVTYAVTYASVGTAMVFALTVKIEAL